MSLFLSFRPRRGLLQRVSRPIPLLSRDLESQPPPSCPLLLADESGESWISTVILYKVRRHKLEISRGEINRKCPDSETLPFHLLATHSPSSPSGPRTLPDAFVTPVYNKCLRLSRTVVYPTFRPTKLASVRFLISDPTRPMGSLWCQL